MVLSAGGYALSAVDASSTKLHWRKFVNRPDHCEPFRDVQKAYMFRIYQSDQSILKSRVLSVRHCQYRVLDLSPILATDTK